MFLIMNKKGWIWGKLATIGQKAQQDIRGRVKEILADLELNTGKVYSCISLFSI